MLFKILLPICLFAVPIIAQTTQSANGYVDYFWIRNADGTSKIARRFIPDSNPITDKPLSKNERDRAKKYLEDNWDAFNKYVAQNPDYAGLNLSRYDMLAALNAIDSAKAMDDQAFSKLSDKSGVTDTRVVPAQISISQGFLNSVGLDSNAVAQLLAHEAMHAAIANSGFILSKDVADKVKKEEELIYGYLDKHSLFPTDDHDPTKGYWNNIWVTVRGKSFMVQEWVAGK